MVKRKGMEFITRNMQDSRWQGIFDSHFICGEPVERIEGSALRPLFPVTRSRKAIEVSIMRRGSRGNREGLNNKLEGHA